MSDKVQWDLLRAGKDRKFVIKRDDGRKKVERSGAVHFPGRDMGNRREDSVVSSEMT